MEDPARAQLHQDDYVQRAERGGDQDEEVAGDDHVGMIADEGQPTLLWIGRAQRSAGAQVLSYRPRRHPNAEFQLQFVRDSFLTPCRIPGCHLSDELAQVLWEPRSSRWSGFPSPKQAEAFPMP